MNEAKACSGEAYPTVPPYPGVYSDGKGHSLQVTYAPFRGSSEIARAIVTALPTAPLSQCAYLHADNDPDFQCSFRPVSGSQYCSFHRTAVAGEIVHAKAEEYDKLMSLLSINNGYFVIKDDVINSLRLSLRNQPDTKKQD